VSADTLPPAAIADTLPPPAGDELPSPRASAPAMLATAQIRMLQLPVSTIEALLRIVDFLGQPNRGVRIDALPTGAVDVTLLDRAECVEEMLLGYHLDHHGDVGAATAKAFEMLTSRQERQ
jgi:hypothetical protein